MNEASSSIEPYLLECAYRKAKTELFYDRSVAMTNEIVDFQANIYENLHSIQIALSDGDFDSFFKQYPIRTTYIAKKLSIKPLKNSKSHVYHSNIELSGKLDQQIKESTAEFREIALFPFAIHILSAYWVMTVGEKFDNKLSSNSYASRISRLKDKKVHHTKLSLFKPYYYDYERWRKNGLQAIERALENDDNIAVMTFDFSAYYHNIDPRFVISPEYIEKLGINLTEWEYIFTEAFVSYIRKWNPKERKLRSLPIGLSMSSLLANVFLAEFDHEIEHEVSPVYYGRYMDDLLLAIRISPDKIFDQNSFIKYLGEKVSYFNGVKQSERGDYKLNSPKWSLQSTLSFNQEKQKLFILYGKSGLDLVNNIGTTIDEISSERRLLPTVDALTRSKAAMTLTVSNDADGPSDTLRKADGLTLKRFGWSVLMRSANLLGTTLKPEEWEEQRNDFCDFAKQLVLQPLAILDNATQIPRLFNLFVSQRDWALAFSVLEKIGTSLNSLQSTSLKVNGIAKKKAGNILNDFKRSLELKITDTVLQSVDIKKMSQVDYSKLLVLLNELKHNLPFETIEGLKSYVIKVHSIDFGLNPVNEPGIYKGINGIDRSSVYLNHNDRREIIDNFILLTQNSFGVNYSSTSIPRNLIDRSYLTKAIAYPTRPFKVSQIFNLIQHSLDQNSPRTLRFSDFRKIVAALRGTWLPDADTGGYTDNDELIVETGNRRTLMKIGTIDSSGIDYCTTLGLSHLISHDKEWYDTAANKPQLTVDRYNRIATIVNQALRAKVKPQYLLLPELSVPVAMTDIIASKLEKESINLILGAEYTHYTEYSTNKRKVFSTAEVFLIEKRLGYNGFIQITQRKGLPAPHEDKGLLKLHNLHWLEDKSVKPLYNHNGFAFGILVCSELQNVMHRKSFQGSVDALFVLSWNKDLETFNALMEASAIDIHAFTAIVNNRRYGDTRLRVPFKTDYKRDVFRIKGGENEMLGVVKIDYGQLRKFQSKAKRWVEETDIFKPVPEDFVISHSRKTVPPET